jgi:hypothetical protein
VINVSRPERRLSVDWASEVSNREPITNTRVKTFLIALILELT